MAETNIKDVKLKIGTETQFQSKLKDLPINTLVGTTDPIQEGELDTSIINKLNKAENALPKPTNDTTGSAGQVLKKTANGSEWGDAPSGGSKLYKHTIDFNFADSDFTNEYLISFVVYSAISEPVDTISKFRNLYGIQTPTCIINTKGRDAVGVGYLKNLLDDSSYPELHGYLGSWTPISNMAFTNIHIKDTVTEL